MQLDQFVYGFKQKDFVCIRALLLLHGGQESGAAQVVEHHKSLRFVHMQYLGNVKHIEKFLHF